MPKEALSVVFGVAFAFARSALLSLTLLVAPAVASAADYPTYIQPQSSADIVGFNIQTATAAAQPSRYVSWGQAFVQGKVAANALLTARIGGQTYPAQMDVKTRYSDDTVRFAVITVRAPQLAGNETQRGVLMLGGAAGSPVNLSSALANYHVSIALSGGLSATIDIRAKILEALSRGTATYWLQGRNATQARVDVPVSGSFHIVVDVTAYADGTFQTDAQFRNDYSMQSTGGTANYTATISQSGSVIYASPSLTHYQYTVWRRVFHTNGDPTSDTHNVQRDIAYYIKAGALPNYDLTSGIADSAIGSVRSTNIAPLSNPGIEKVMGMAGHRDDIGPMPAWHARWLKSQNANAARAAIAMGNGGGSIPWHHFDPATNDHITLDKYPKLWIDDGNRGDVDLRQPVRDTSWRMENAHTPDVAFIPYLFTGDRYFLDELNAQATMMIFLMWPYTRKESKGIIFSSVYDDAYEVRASAWTFRNVSEAAWANPDGTATKAYWRKILDANYDELTNLIIPKWNNRAKEVAGYFFGAYPATLIAPWQQDYMISALAAAALRGDSRVLPIIHWSQNWQVGRFINQAKGHGWAAASAYQYIVSTPAGVFHDTWAKLAGSNGSSNTLVADGSNFVTLPLMTLAGIYNVNGNADALRVYNQIKAQNLNGFRLSDYRTHYPQFHIVPVSSAATPALRSTPTTGAPSLTLSASPASITVGQSSTLTWVSTNSASCTASGGWSGPKATRGTQAVSPTANATYTLTCTGAGGAAGASASVAVRR